MGHDHAAEANTAKADMLAARETGKELLYITNDRLGKRERLMIACKDRQHELRVLGAVMSNPIENQNCNTALGIVLAVDPMNIHNLQEHFHIVRVETSHEAHRRYDAIKRLPQADEGATMAEKATASRNTGGAFKLGV